MTLSIFQYSEGVTHIDKTLFAQVQKHDGIDDKHRFQGPGLACPELVDLACSISTAVRHLLNASIFNVIPHRK